MVPHARRLEGSTAHTSPPHNHFTPLVGVRTTIPLRCTNTFSPLVPEGQLHSSRGRICRRASWFPGRDTGEPGKSARTITWVTPLAFHLSHWGLLLANLFVSAWPETKFSTTLSPSRRMASPSCQYLAIS